MRKKRDDMKGYTPLVWGADSRLSKHEQEMVEIQREDLWRRGVRTQPLLDRMAFEFAAVVCMFQTEPR